MASTTTKRIIASAISIGAFIVIGIILYIYIPNDSAPSTSSSANLDSNAQKGDSQIRLPTPLSNASTYVTELASNAGMTISNVSNAIRDSLLSPSLQSEEAKLLTRKVMTIGGFAIVLILVGLLYKRTRMIMSSRAYMVAMNTHSVSGLLKSSMLIFRLQLNVVFRTMRVLVAIVGVIAIFLLLYRLVGLANFFSYLLAILPYNLCISVCAYAICKQLGLTSPIAIRKAIETIDINTDGSLFQKAVENAVTGPLLIILPFLFFGSLVSMANWVVGTERFSQNGKTPQNPGTSWIDWFLGVGQTSQDYDVKTLFTLGVAATLGLIFSSSFFVLGVIALLWMEASKALY